MYIFFVPGKAKNNQKRKKGKLLFNVKPIHIKDQPGDQTGKRGIHITVSARGNLAR
jgi:hypothetical protein